MLLAILAAIACAPMTWILAAGAIFAYAMTRKETHK